MNKFFWNVLIIFFVVTIVSCKTSVDKPVVESLSISDCYAERKNEDILTSQSGSIIKVADQFVILAQDKYSRYMCCNLPDSYKKEGVMINYSLIVKEIYPNERLIASPAYLMDIKH